MDAPTKAVFVSYASEDAEPARRLCETLRTAGLEVWFDQNELRGGDAWDAEIRRRIRTCALFVPIISANTEQRAEGYFRLEWKLAVDRSHMMSEDQAFLLPVALDGVAQTSVRVPDRFREIQWTRFADDGALAAFAARMQRLLGGAVDAPAQAPPRRATPGATKASRGTPSIAVLPFVNLSRDEENEYFADGLSEELLNVLAGIRGLRVASRTSAFFFKGKSIDLPTVAAKLNVATILEGSVRKAGKRVRITAQLIDVAADSHLWSQTYDRELDDIFAVQDDIAQAVVTELRRAIFGADVSTSATSVELKAAAPGRTENAEAHQLFLQGRFYFDRTGEQEIARAIGYFEQAVAADPGFGLAWAELSTAYVVRSSFGWAGVEGYDLARKAAEKAIALAPDLAEAHLSLCRVLVLEWKWPEATAEMERALKLAPGAGVVLRAAGRHATHLGQIDKAIEYFEKAVSLDPLSFSAHVNLGIRYMFANRFDDAERQIRIGLDINPSATVAHFGLANVSLFRGRPREALELVKAERMPHLHRLMGVIAYHTLGEFAKSDAALEDMIANFADTSACEIANAYGWRGETDKAFEWLDRAYRQRDAGLASMLSDPLMRSLHGDARWEPFLKKLGLK